MIHFEVGGKISINLGINDDPAVGYAIGVKAKNYEIFISRIVSRLWFYPIDLIHCYFIHISDFDCTNCQS